MPPVLSPEEYRNKQQAPQYKVTGDYAEPETLAVTPDENVAPVADFAFTRQPTEEEGGPAAAPLAAPLASGQVAAHTRDNAEDTAAKDAVHQANEDKHRAAVERGQVQTQEAQQEEQSKFSQPPPLASTKRQAPKAVKQAPKKAVAKKAVAKKAPAKKSKGRK